MFVLLHPKIILCLLIAISIGVEPLPQHRQDQVRHLIHRNPKPIRFHRISPIRANMGDGHVVTQIPIIKIALATLDVEWITNKAHEKIGDPTQYSVLLSTAASSRATTGHG